MRFSRESQTRCRMGRRCRAFTLVEVVMALGLASFGLISMMGLLTVGLMTAHSAMSATTETEIAQQLANQMQLASYKTLTASTTTYPTNYYFTQEGVQTNAANAVYFAQVNAPTMLSVPGATSATALNTATVVISIWSVSSPQTNAVPIQIANNGS